MAGIEVVGTVTGGRVNDAAALIERDVIGENARHLNRQEGMLKFHSLEIAPLIGGAQASFFDAAFGLQSRNAIGGQQQCALFGFHDGVVEIGMKGKRAIVRNRPGRGRPDNRADIVSNFRGISLAAAHNSELHPDRWALVIFVLYFRFGERGAVKEAGRRSPSP